MSSTRSLAENRVTPRPFGKLRTDSSFPSAGKDEGDGRGRSRLGSIYYVCQSVPKVCHFVCAGPT